MSNLEVFETYKVEIILILFIIITWERFDVIEIKSSLFYGLVGYGIYKISQDYLWKQKYKSPHLIADNMTASCINYTERGIYRFYELGGIEGIPEEIQESHKEGVMIVPIESCGMLGKQHYTLCQVTRINIQNLDIESRNWILEQNYSMDKIYYGKVSRKYYIEHPDKLTEFIKERSQESLISDYEAIVKKIYAIQQNFVSNAGIINKEQSWWQKFTPFGNKKQEDEKE